MDNGQNSPTDFLNSDRCAEPVMQTLGYVLYRSVARPGLTGNDLDIILTKARVWNQSVALTGCLHHEGGMFYQWLEGPRSELYRLLDRIVDDSRHLNVMVLDQGVINKRLFEAWEMRFTDREASSILDWLAERRDKTNEENPKNVVEFLRSIKT